MKRLVTVAQRHQIHEGVEIAAQTLPPGPFCRENFDNSSDCSAFGGEVLENLLSEVAFAGLVAAQFLSVVLVSTPRSDDPFPGTGNRKKAAGREGSQGRERGH